MGFTFSQALSGLDAAAQALDVAGNNISNANTTAYKHYKVVMTSLRNNTAAGSMQVADIKLASNGRAIAAGLGQNGIAWTDVTRGALNNGLSKEEIKEILLQCAVYASVPAANHAFKEAGAFFAENGL